MPDFIELSELKKGLGGISSIQCSYYLEACTVLFDLLDKESGIVLHVDFDKQKEIRLVWESTPSRKRGWKNEAKLIENAATAIAFLVVTKYSPHTIIEEAVIGTGVDYWLAYEEEDENYDELNFFNARLEISGLKKGSDSMIQRRLKIKEKQSMQSDGTSLPCYISITEFGKPQTILKIR